MWGWIEELAVNIFIVVVFLFALYLIVVFLFSLHPKTRRIASKLSIFLDEPGVEELREKVEGIDKDLQKIKSTLEDIEKHLKDNRKLK
jgi:Skp family chaperone for outer membrane proteins